MRQPQSVYVRNMSAEVFRDRFDGEDFEFAPGEYVQVPLEAAKLIFGFGEQDKFRAIRRLGWATTAVEIEKAHEKLKAFQFHMEAPYAVHQPAPVGASDPSSDPDADSGSVGSEEGGDTSADVDLQPVVTAGPQRNLLNKLAATAPRG